MSGLTKKAVYADKLLSTLLGVNEGDFVSYADISRGLHKYIKDNNLRQGSPKLQPPSPEVSLPSQPPTPSGSESARYCRDCGAEIPAEAVFCDLCGVSQ